MRVLFLSNVMGVGGTDRQIQYIAQELDRRGHEVKILSLRPLRDMGKNALASGLDVSSVEITGSWEVPSSIIQLVKEIREYDPDVLSCFLFHSNMLGRVLGTTLRIPVIITSIRNEDLGGRFRGPTTKATNWLDDAVVTNSSTVGNKLINRGIFSRGHHRTIHNCVDTDHFCPAAADRHTVRSELGIPDEKFVWITVGRLNPQKDHQNLLNAVEIIERDNMRTLIVGDGMCRERLESMCQSKGLEDEVLFLGERDDVARLLASSDAFVLPSRWEGLPNVVMEAMSCGLPVVSTHVGGVPELINNSGIIVDKNNSRKLRDGMLQIMSLTDQELSQMGNSGREYMLKHFSVDKIVDEWVELYRECKI